MPHFVCISYHPHYMLHLELQGICMFVNALVFKLTYDKQDTTRTCEIIENQML